MQIVQETLARGFTTTLASSLRAVAQVSIRDIEQCPYDEFVREIPNPTILTLLNLAPLPGSAMMHIPLRVGYAATELMLGGVGGANQPRRSMTDLELSLMRNVVELMLPELRYAFESVVPLEPTIISQESNPQFAQLAAPTDIVILITFDVRVESVTDVMTLCIPFSSLQPHLEALSVSHGEGQNGDKIAQQRARVHEHLHESQVVTRARFAPAWATSGQIVQLEVGDVLLLNHPVTRPLTVDVDDVAIYDATIGQVGRHLALQIQGPIPEDRRRRPSKLQVVSAPRD